MASDPTYRVRNWAEFQHYGNRRSPPWVKLHRSLLNNREWYTLSGDASKLLVECWLVASETLDGSIPLTASDIAWRLHRSESDAKSWLKELVTQRFIEVCGEDASNVLAECEQDASPDVDVEKEKESEEKKKLPSEAKKKRASRLPDSWKPNEKHAALANSLHIDMAVEAEKMRDWAAANGQVKADWDATFRNWLRNAKPNGFTNGLSDSHHGGRTAAPTRREAPGHNPIRRRGWGDQD